MKYAEGRDLVQDGDVVFVGRGTSIAAGLTEFVTGSPYFHVGIAFWMRDAHYESRLMMIEASQGGRRIVSLSCYQQYALSVVESEIPFGVYQESLLDRAGAVPYSYLDFASIGLFELLRIKLPMFKGEVCSQMVAQALNAGGLYLPQLISPGKLFSRLVRDLSWKRRLQIN